MQNEDIAEALALRRRDEETRRLQAEAKTRRKVRDQARQSFGAPYGNSSSYTPATDACPAPFVQAADVYSPAPADSSPSFDGAGGSFDGGGASGDY